MGGAVGGFFTHASMGKLRERVKLREHLHRDFPEGLGDDSGISIQEIARQFRESGLLQGVEGWEDDKVHLLLEEARMSFGNWTPFAEFNVSAVALSVIESNANGRLDICEYIHINY
jgi:hypothetical protein